jgi:hypothetical protein
VFGVPFVTFLNPNDRSPSASSGQALQVDGSDGLGENPSLFHYLPKPCGFEPAKPKANCFENKQLKFLGRERFLAQPKTRA